MDTGKQLRQISSHPLELPGASQQSMQHASLTRDRDIFLSNLFNFGETCPTPICYGYLAHKD